MRLIIDSHLDLAWNALSWNRDITRPLAEINSYESGMTAKARGRATTSFPQMRRGGVAVCLATVLARAKPEMRPEAGLPRTSPDFVHADIAYASAQGQLAYYRLLEARGELRMLHTAADLEQHWRQWQGNGDRRRLPIGAILAMEGADPIVSPAQAEAWFHLGLRSVGLAHYGKSRYAVGTGDRGSLTNEGRQLLAELERLGMILDVTHLSEPSFFEALDGFGGAVMASHNNCRALVPGDRQFSDQQIKLLIQRGAVIGVACDAWMLHPNWEIGKTPREVVRLDAVVDHLDHICQLAGNCRHAAIGSDLDGGYGTEQTPLGLDSIADLQALGEMLSRRGYGDADIDAIFHGNWLTFFLKHLAR